MNELFELRKSLQDGKCSFKKLPDADKKALQAMVDEQERNGQNPWGKRKRRSDAGKPKKKQKTSASTAHLGNYPPSCSSSDHETHEEMDARQIDLGPVVVCGNLSTSSRSLTSVKRAHHSSSKSRSVSAFSSALVAGPSTVPTPITSVESARERERGHYHSGSSNQHPKVFPTLEFASHYYDSESGEEEIVEGCEDDTITHLNRLTKSFRG